MARTDALIRARRGSVHIAALLLLPALVEGQAQRESTRVDVRADAIAKTDDTPASVHLGAGVARRFGVVQLAALAGAGPSSEGVTGRAEAAARFHVDAFRERRWGLYGAAGGGVQWSSGSSEPFLLLLLGLEGARGSSGWSPLLEAGFSRGVRVAAGVRRTPVARR